MQDRPSRVGRRSTGPDMSAYKFIIADDHPLFRGPLRPRLHASVENAHVQDGGSLDELADGLSAGGETALVLVVLTMPGVHGVSGLRYLRPQQPEVPGPTVGSGDAPPTIRHCIDCGA